MAQVFGYIRIAPGPGSFREQFDTLRTADLDRIFMESGSRGGFQHELMRLLREAQKGDTILVARLATLARSTSELLQIIGLIDDHGLILRSILEEIDTSSEDGESFTRHAMWLRVFESHLAAERVASGLARARSLGKNGGRPRVMTKDQVRMAQTMHNDQRMSVTQIAAALKVGRSTVYRAIQRAEI